MKYLGEKSLSSFLSVLLNIAWYVVLIGCVAGGIFFLIMIFQPSGGIAEAMELTSDSDWQKMVAMPLVLKILMIPYGATVLVLLLIIIRKCRSIFNNFSREEVFRPENVDLIRETGKVLLVLSIITFQLGALIASLLLLLLCEVFKSGAALQEEHDLTV